MIGLLNVYKPAGPTSHDIVAWIRAATGTRRVGHTGTLDPGAAGVLVLCLGAATRLVEYLMAGEKHYRAEAAFGFVTDTEDAQGRIVRECPTEGLTAAAGCTLQMTLAEAEALLVPRITQALGE